MDNVDKSANLKDDDKEEFKKESEAKSSDGETCNFHGNFPDSTSTRSVIKCDWKQ